MIPTALGESTQAENKVALENKPDSKLSKSQRKRQKRQQKLAGKDEEELQETSVQVLAHAAERLDKKNDEGVRSSCDPECMNVY